MRINDRLEIRLFWELEEPPIETHDPETEVVYVDITFPLALGSFLFFVGFGVCVMLAQTQ